jgi:hypothetical protein
MQRWRSYHEQPKAEANTPPGELEVPAVATSTVEPSQTPTDVEATRKIAAAMAKPSNIP